MEKGGRKARAGREEEKDQKGRARELSTTQGGDVKGVKEVMLKSKKEVVGPKKVEKEGRKVSAGEEEEERSMEEEEGEKSKKHEIRTKRREDGKGVKGPMMNSKKEVGGAQEMEKEGRMQGASEKEEASLGADEDSKGKMREVRTKHREEG